MLIVSKNGTDELATTLETQESLLPTVYMHSQSLKVIGIKGGAGTEGDFGFSLGV